jgi:DNA-binding transcriptional MerR regulator
MTTTDPDLSTTGATDGRETSPPEAGSGEDLGANLRIGEVARLTGLTTRTLRYWEEIGLLAPSAYRDSGERMYAPDDAARAGRIRELQDLLGFSLAEVRMVLETEDVIHQLKTAYSVDRVAGQALVAMLDEAVEASERLLDRLDDSLARLRAFRDERAATLQRLRIGRSEVATRCGATGRSASRPTPGAGRGD